jgi:putative hemolysin
MMMRVYLFGCKTQFLFPNFSQSLLYFCPYFLFVFSACFYILFSWVLFFYPFFFMKNIFLLFLIMLGVVSFSIRETHAIANPASVKCTKDSGTLQIKTTTDGSQYGSCILPTGIVCEEWSYFHGTCSTTTSIVMPGSDKDSHGCIGSAGYTWSVSQKQCVRPWEDKIIVNMDRPYTDNVKLDLILQTKANRIEKLFRKEAGEMMTTDSQAKPELNITYDVVQTGAIIAVRMDVYTFLGGAHGTEVSYTWNYDTKTGKNIFLLQTLSRAKLMTLAKNIEKKLLDKRPQDFTDVSWLQTGLSVKRLANYGTFTVGTDASGKVNTVTFYFDDYQVGPHSIGRPVVSVDVATLAVTLQD